MERNFNYELEKISNEINDIKINTIKINEQISNCEDIFRENDHILNDLHSVWKDGEMKNLIFDMELELRKNKTKLLNELYSEEDELNKKRKKLEYEYNDIYS